MTRYCTHEGCSTIACYGDPKTKKKTHCAKHKPEGYVDLKNKLCEHEGCSTIASFGDPMTKKITHCAKHKLEGYVNLQNKRCEHEGCSTLACYGDPKTKKRTHCAKHKPEGYVDLQNKRCEHEGCSTQANYGDPETKKKTHCVKHKPEGYVDLRNKLCEHEGCSTLANYGDPETKKMTHCAKHKLEGYVDLRSKLCVAEHGCTTRSNPEYDWYCTHCFRNLFPHDPRTRNIRAKTREIAVRDFLVERYGDAFVHNQTLFTSCDCDHRRGVDFRRIIGGTMLAVEVDERQHDTRSYRDDAEARYNDLAVAFGGKWVFIRFNPDSYIDAKGQRIKGFFDAKGERRPSEIARRMEALAECIDEQIERIERDENIELLEETFLFFDET